MATEREKLAWLLAAFGIGLGLACGIGWYRASGKVRTVEKTVDKPGEAETAQLPPATLTPNEHLRQLLEKATIVTGSDLLKGIDKVRVNVIVGKACEPLVDASSLQVKAELRLRSLGIQVGEEPLIPTLFIATDGMWTGDEKDSIRFFCYKTTASIDRYAIFNVQGVPHVGPLDAWSNGSFGYAGSAKVKESLADSVQGVVDAFANQYLAANPKK